MGEERGMDALDALRLEARRFAEERDRQSSHTPKNLAVAVSVEAGKLLEVFQWLAADDVESVASAGTTWQAAREMADVLINLVRLADVLGVDLLEAAHDKLRIDARRYPVDQARGA